MNYEGFNQWMRKLLPFVAFLFFFLLITYLWLATVKFLPEIAALLYPSLSTSSIDQFSDIGPFFIASSSIFSCLTIAILVLLFWRQRQDKQQQEETLRSIKSDFENNRLNNLIINQVNRIEYLVESLSFQDLDDEVYEGSYGIDFLNATLKINDIAKFRTGEAAGKEEEALVVANYKSIKRLLLAIAQSNQTIEDQILVSNIGLVEKERLYAIYLRNLGASVLVLLRKLESFTDIIINSENTYQHKELDFSNPVFILSELSAGFFHNIASNCQSRLIDQIVPEPI